MKPDLVAPCGINCSHCYAFMRTKDSCSGCRFSPSKKTCTNCIIRNCKKLKNKFCSKSNCPDYPCNRLKKLDKRYRENYGLSLIANLEAIRNEGIRAFIKEEQNKWKCECGNFYSIHRKECMYCKKKKNVKYNF